MTAVGDAVDARLVTSLARPGGNVTGITFLQPELAAKRLELLKEAVPGIAQVGVLFNPANANIEPVRAAMRRRAQSLRLELTEFPVRDAGELDAAAAAIAAKPIRAFVASEDPLIVPNSPTIAKLALQYRLVSCGFPELAKSGGVVGFGADFLDMWRHAATFVDKIIKGANPADLPVEQPTSFKTIVNLKTANAIGLDVPTSFLLRADEVIE
jgi:putative ABC transport system substrate-binding protein